MADNSKLTIREKTAEVIIESMVLQLLEDTDSDDDDDIIEDGILSIAYIYETRYLIERMPVAKNPLLINNLLPSYDDERFRRTVRMNREQFKKILSLIQDHECFSSLKNNQYPVAVQLLIVLNRFGLNGNAAGIMPIARDFGVGDGGTLNIFTKRVIKALLSLEKKFLYWPNQEERRELAVYMTGKLMPQCIGFVDGMHVNLSNALQDDPISYFNRKGQYSLNVQLVADPMKRIRMYHVGQPGKVHDARVYSLMSLYTAPQNYFSEDQYILGDPAYKLTSTVITPFRKIPGITRDQEKFNYHLSKCRVKFEHVNGILKSRFGSLRGLRMVINRQSGHQFGCEWIVACLILYNMLVIEDPWDNDDFNSDQTELQMDDEACNGQEDDLSARKKRDDLCNFVVSHLD